MKTYGSLIFAGDIRKFTIKALLCNTEWFYIVDGDVYLSNTHRIVFLL